MQSVGLGLSVFRRTVYQMYISEDSENVMEPVYYPERTGDTLSGYLAVFPALIVKVLGPEEFMRSVST